MSDYLQSVPSNTELKMTSESNPVDCVAREDVIVNTKTTVSHAANENATSTSELEPSGSKHTPANLCFPVGASTVEHSESNQEVSAVYGHHAIASKTSSAPPMAQLKSNGNVPMSSAVKPIIVMTPSTMNMKSFNFNQLTFPIHGIQGLQLAMPNSNQPMHPVCNIPTTEMSLSEPVTPNSVHSLSGSMVALPTPTTPLSAQPPLTPSIPIERDPFGQTDRIPITCRKNNAIFDRRKLGSGQRGNCILFENRWITPSEFEIACGLSTSRDWKRSIRYGGFTFQKLINEGFLKPHSALCTCAVCSDDDSVTCPIRLFQPYKRRKRSSTIPSGGNYLEKKPNINEKGKVLRQSSAEATFDPLMNNLNNKNPETESAMRVLLAEQVDKTLRVCKPLVALEGLSQLTEQRMWWQLEEISNNLLEQAQRLKVAVAEAKANSLNQRVALVQKLMAHIQKDQVAEPSMLIGQVHSGFTQELNSASAIHSSVLVEDNQKVQLSFGKDLIKVEMANLHQFCNTCGGQALSECTGCHKATYCSTACQEKDWLNGHSDVCQSSKVAEQTIENKTEKVVSSSSSDVDSLVVMPTASVLPNSCSSAEPPKHHQVEVD